MKPAEKKKSAASGVLSATGAAIKYLVIPLFFVYIIGRLLPGLGVDFSSFILGTIIIGIALVIIGFIYGYFWKGSRERLLAGLAGVALAIIWILVIVGGFNMGAAFESFSFRLDMSGLFLIIAAGISLKAVYHLAEYKVYKDELDLMEHSYPQGVPPQGYAGYGQQPGIYPYNYNNYNYAPPPAGNIPPPPPPDDGRDKQNGGLNFRHYDDIRNNTGGIEWKKPEDEVEIKPHTKR